MGKRKVLPPMIETSVALPDGGPSLFTRLPPKAKPALVLRNVYYIGLPADASAKWRSRIAQAFVKKGFSLRLEDTTHPVVVFSPPPPEIWRAAKQLRFNKDIKEADPTWLVDKICATLV